MSTNIRITAELLQGYLTCHVTALLYCDWCNFSVTCQIPVFHPYNNSNKINFTPVMRQTSKLNPSKEVETARLLPFTTVRILNYKHAIRIVRVIFLKEVILTYNISLMKSKCKMKRILHLWHQ